MTRTHVVLGLVVLAVSSPRSSDARSVPGRDDAAVFAVDRWTTALRTHAQVGTARPWADLPVRTDWIAAGVARGSFAVATGFGRAVAGATRIDAIDARAEMRARGVALRLGGGRRTTAVDSFEAERVTTAAVGLRVRRGAVAMVFGVDAERPDASGAAWTALPVAELEVHRGPLRVGLRRQRGRHVEGDAHRLAVALDVAASLCTGMVFAARETVWSVRVHVLRTRVRVSRVVDGPRVGAVAVGLEWWR